jgi:hypothetical protein
MLQIHQVFFGAAAITFALGAAQFASCHDLADRWNGAASSGAVSKAAPAGDLVNRSAKADRIADPKPTAVPTRTVTLRLNDLADTSVLLRVPMVEARSIKPAAPSLLQTRTRKPAVACEPVVSSLTEVAKLLQPGRCVT